jgi:hypothetical protein
MQSCRTTYGVTEYVADTKEDVARISKCVMGSTVYVIHTKETYMIDSKGVWYPVNSDDDPIQCDCVEESTIWEDLKEE